MLLDRVATAPVATRETYDPPLKRLLQADQDPRLGVRVTGLESTRRKLAARAESSPLCHLGCLSRPLLLARRAEPVDEKAPGSVATRGYNTSGDGGDDGNRTHDLLLAKQMLYQLSYVPVKHGVPATER